jgi:hypothetical protein
MKQKLNKLKETKIKSNFILSLDLNKIIIIIIILIMMMITMRTIDNRELLSNKEV